MAFLGYNIINTVSVPDVSQNTVSAATVSHVNVSAQDLPLDLFLDQAKKRLDNDTVYLHDTITVENTKYVKVPVTKHTTDTIYYRADTLPNVDVLSVKNRSPGDREEQSLDDAVDTKSTVELTIDGKMVYSSKNDNHSGGIQNDSTSVPDGLEKP